jgi:hypothetical protein
VEIVAAAGVLAAAVDADVVAEDVLAVGAEIAVAVGVLVAVGAEGGTRTSWLQLLCHGFTRTPRIKPER